MSSDNPQRDLVVLAADKSIEMALRGVLGRHESLGIRKISAEFLVHLQHDPGCVRTSDRLLRSYVNSTRYAIVVLDHEGSGRESVARDELETEVEAHLAQNGWPDRAAVIVIEPELENWVWSESPEVDVALGWGGREPHLRTWLRENSLWSQDDAKPARPKKAMQLALREVRKPWSSSIHGQLAQKVSLSRCTDPAFDKLKSTLRNWFSQE